MLEAHGITKRFSGVRALRGIDLTLRPGEVLAIIGENGAGKSTLMKILAGVQSPDEGEIRIDGAPVRIGSVHHALQLGIALIHQELNLADNLDVAGNIFLGREPRRFGGFIDSARMHREAKQYLDRVGLSISPATRLDQLTIARQQLVEIAKALSIDARILIMDEPTSSLSAVETAALFRVIRELRERGVAIVYISHRLGEIREIADRAIVLRDGANAGALELEEITHDNMVRLMVGRDISQFYVREPHPPGEALLQVRGLVTALWPRQRIDFSIRAREIVAITGLIGAGRTDVLRAVFGIDRPLAGEISVSGQLLRSGDPVAAIEAGIMLVPEDRKQAGLVLQMSVCHNIGLPGLWRHRRGGAFIDRRREECDCDDMVGKLQIKTVGRAQIVENLSGGNQQKVVIGKWLALGPRAMLLDEPTRGVDVGAKREIYRLMDELAARGMAVLFVSSEMEEVIGMADRALVMHEGGIAGELARAELAEEAIMRLATGQRRAA